MRLVIEKSTKTGFCFGVKRAIDMLTKATAERGPIETLGAVVHNQQVMNRLAGLGISVAGSLDEMKGGLVAIGSHGVSPQVETEMKSRFAEVINTTCPFVHRAQVAARRLAAAGFHVVVYGEANHPEVRGILGYAQGKGIATMDESFLTRLQPRPRRLGVLSQTTQVPERFVAFARNVLDALLARDAELRFIDTICHDIRERQQAALDLARRVDVMLVVGSRTSANTNHLTALCSTVTTAHLIETADAVEPEWLEGRRVGITSGASTPQDTIDSVIARLELLR